MSKEPSAATWSRARPLRLVLGLRRSGGGAAAALAWVFGPGGVVGRPVSGAGAGAGVGGGIGAVISVAAVSASPGAAVGSGGLLLSRATAGEAEACAVCSSLTGGLARGASVVGGVPDSSGRGGLAGSRVGLACRPTAALALSPTTGLASPPGAGSGTRLLFGLFAALAAAWGGSRGPGRAPGAGELKLSADPLAA